MVNLSTFSLTNVLFAHKQIITFSYPRTFKPTTQLYIQRNFYYISKNARSAK